jgi:hypothetical protein
MPNGCAGQSRRKLPPKVKVTHQAPISLANDLPRILVLPQSHKLDVADVTRIRPFQELEVRDELRLHLDALLPRSKGFECNPDVVCLRRTKQRDTTCVDDCHIMRFGGAVVLHGVIRLALTNYHRDRKIGLHFNIPEVRVRDRYTIGRQQLIGPFHGPILWLRRGP